MESLSLEVGHRVVLPRSSVTMQEQVLRLLAVGTPAATSLRENCEQVLQAASCDGEPGALPAACSSAGASTKQGCSDRNNNRHYPGGRQPQGPGHSADTSFSHPWQQRCFSEQEHGASSRAPASNAGSDRQFLPQQQVPWCALQASCRLPPVTPAASAEHLCRGEPLSCSQPITPLLHHLLSISAGFLIPVVHFLQRDVLGEVMVLSQFLLLQK